MSKTARRVALAEAQNWRCAHCGETMDLQPDGWNSATVEHVIPISQGGLRDWGNEVAAHRRCNEARGSQPLDELSQRIAIELTAPARAARKEGAVEAARKHLGEVARQINDARIGLAPYTDDLEVATLFRSLTRAEAVVRGASTQKNPWIRGPNAAPSSSVAAPSKGDRWALGALPACDRASGGSGCKRRHSEWEAGGTCRRDGRYRLGRSGG